MRKIKLTQGKYALVDGVDFEELSKHKWHAEEGGNTWYARRGELPQIRMHRMVLGLVSGDGKIVDHRNRNGLDNRRSNLGVVSKSENQRNNGGYADNTSGHTGVAWEKSAKKWCAQITVNYKHIHLGYFDNIEDAIEARQLGEKKYWIDK